MVSGGRASTAAIAGLGVTRMTLKYASPAPVLAVEAIRLAIEDAGLRKDDIDGLLINRSSVATGQSLSLELQRAAGLRNLRLTNLLEGEGSTARSALHDNTGVPERASQHARAAASVWPKCPWGRWRTCFSEGISPASPPNGLPVRVGRATPRAGSDRRSYMFEN
jgi:hypothetical protein